ncbi:Serine/threonine-protein kinase PAK 3 [Apophysomyces ossiformis]|uniref:Serine/threonine-protein kinase PAK 3 n=1 Tax=Apophysomyces ossiformis TaxID=679940 RepID=A0A8H7ES55_9FUNG|nr:Serine/threonine-protein kinase PAK 3 [Apophysomyces ossiformis]
MSFRRKVPGLALLFQSNAFRLMQQVNGVPVYNADPGLYYEGLNSEPTWFSAQGGVYKCRDRTHPSTQVAIKKYLVEEESQYEDMFVMPKELVENEIYTMTKCVHPNILKLIAVYLHEEFVYLIMPLCTGGSLQQYVFEHQLTVGQMVHIVISIASGLAEIHRHGYIHRDIKCDNIFLDQESNSVVIGDFGVVSITPAADSNVEEAGVVLFWAPELVQRKIVNRKIDIWALGIVILEILNGGKAPYEDEKLEEDEIKQRILENGRPEYPPGLPSRLVDLLDRCLEPDPKLRASANSILQHPFLCDYEPELLFPISQADQDQSSIADSEQSESHPSLEDVDDDAMINALKKLRALEALHSFDIEFNSTRKPISTSTSDSQSKPVPSLSPPHPNNLSSTSTLNTEPTESKRKPRGHVPSAGAARKCRLPVPSFVVDEQVATALPAQEKIANVLRKRQSISEINWNQGSRLPMFKAIAEVLVEEPNEETKKTSNVKSVRLAQGSAKSAQQTLRRANTLPARVKQQASPTTEPPYKRKTEPKEKPKQPRSNSTEKTKHVATSSSKEKNKLHVRITTKDTQKIVSPVPPKVVSPLPPRIRPKVLLAGASDKVETKKPSIYRKKRLPGESRTARLMLGISTNGRRHSVRDFSQIEKEVALQSPGRRVGRLLAVKTDAPPERKKRPVSFAADSPMPDNTYPKKFGFQLQPSSSRTTPLPKYDLKARRQSAPAPAKQSSKGKSINRNNDDSTTTTVAKNAAIKSVKTVRVH